MLEHEDRGLPYLFKMRPTAKIKELVRRMMRQGALWQDCGDSWKALETTIRLSGWTRERRVVLVRESPAHAPVREAAKPRRGKDRQKHLPNIQGAGWDAHATPWSGKIAVLVTSLDPQAFPTLVMPKHYRDRADAENGFDELKNEWGWGGYTSRKLAPCRLMANLVALFYNWWTLYLRFYDEGHHREPIRNRPMLMAGAGRQVQSGGQRTLKVSMLHEKGDFIAHAVTRISKELHHIHGITERWSVDQRWTLLLTRLLRRWLGGKWLPGLPDETALLLSGWLSILLRMLQTLWSELPFDPRQFHRCKRKRKSLKQQGYRFRP